MTVIIFIAFKVRIISIAWIFNDCFHFGNNIIYNCLNLFFCQFHIFSYLVSPEDDVFFVAHLVYLL